VAVALYHDPDGRRSRLRAMLAVLVAASLIALVLTMFTGLPEAYHNPLVAPA
jgi:hypothetical protein